MKRKLKQKQKLKYESVRQHPYTRWNRLITLICTVQFNTYFVLYKLSHSTSIFFVLLLFSLWIRKMQIIFIWLSFASVFLLHVLQASFKRKKCKKPYWTRSLIKTFRHSFETFHWKQTKSPSNVRKNSTQIVFETHSMLKQIF